MNFFKAAIAINALMIFTVFATPADADASYSYQKHFNYNIASLQSDGTTGHIVNIPEFNDDMVMLTTVNTESNSLRIMFRDAVRSCKEGVETELVEIVASDKQIVKATKQQSGAKQFVKFNVSCKDSVNADWKYKELTPATKKGSDFVASALRSEESFIAGILFYGHDDSFQQAINYIFELHELKNNPI